MGLAIFQTLSNIYTQAMLEEAYKLGKNSNYPVIAEIIESVLH